MIYCDPPYQNTTKFTCTDQFNYDLFWDWIREKSKTNIVFVSEYAAPDDFECIWQKDITTSLKVHVHEDRTEKLFKFKQ